MTPTAAALPADTARLTPTPLATARFMNDDTKLPDWLAIAIAPGGGYGATICAHKDAGVDTTPWPFGPATAMPSSRARATSSSCACFPASPASPYPADATNTARIPRRAHARSTPSLALAGVHTN